jgi:uncharacterized protein YggE
MMKFRITTILFAAMCTASASFAQPADRTLTVLAAGHASASADKVSLQFTVSSQDPTATGLFVKQNDIVSRLKKALEAGGVKPDEVSEEPFRLLPNMEYGQAGTRIIGYRLDTPIDVELGNVKDLPRVIDLATANGAGSVTVGAFGLTGGRSLHEEAIKSAIASARREASAIAKEMGRTLGDIVSIAETEDAGKAATGGGGEEAEERREGKHGQQQQPNNLSEKAELKVVFELK